MRDSALPKSAWSISALLQNVSQSGASRDSMTSIMVCSYIELVMNVGRILEM